MKSSTRNNTKKVVIASLFAALVCVATMVVKIPTPLKGYANLGDCVVLISGWLLSPGFAFLSAGIGSALADVFSGYAIYAPATFFIKGVMAVVAFLIFSALSKKTGSLLSRLVGGIIAELIMIGGYYVFEGFLYGFAPSVVNIPANAIQGVVGLVLAILIIKITDTRKIKL